MNLKESTCTWYIYYYIISNEICQNNFKCQKWSTNLHIHLFRATNQYLLRNTYIAKNILFMLCSKNKYRRGQNVEQNFVLAKNWIQHTHKNIVNQIMNIVILNYNVSKNRTTEFRLWSVWLDDHQRGFVATRTTDSCNGTTTAFARCYVSTSSKDTRWFFSK